MRSVRHSSRTRFLRYRDELRQRKPGQTISAAGAAALASEGMRGVPGSGHKRQRSFYVLLREFFRLLAGHRLRMAMVLAVASVATMVGLLPLYGTKLVIDNVLGGRPISAQLNWLPLPHQPRALLTAVALGMVSLSLTSIICGVWGRWHATRITKRVQVHVRQKAFDHAVRLPLHRVYELKSGGASSLLREDAGGVGDLVFAMIFNPWRAIIQLSGTLVILTYTDWRLLLGSLVLLPVVYFSHKTWIGRIRPIFSDIRATRQHTDGHATETFGGMRVVRGFSRQRSEAAIFVRNNHLMARQELLAWCWSRAIDIAWSLFIPAATATLLWYGGMRVLDDIARVNAGTLDPSQALTAGDLVMFLGYLGWLLGPLEALASSATQFQNSLAGLDRVLNLLEEPIEMPSKPGALVLSRDMPPAHISLRKVSYSYPKSETPVLKDVNLEVAPGEMVALVGPSGAGKTTLCNLIARFFDPTEGQILFGDVDLREIEVDSYRSLLGVVEQDTFLFDGTVADNIAYGSRHATMEEIVAAAQQANADQFILALPQGYDTAVGERGVKLSGGQRQRLTIARAILADPRILILDEATSNLDTESERLIQVSLQNLMHNRTSFVIAHRLSTIMHAHRIVVIENGTVAEQGRHAELMARSGRYRQMVELQTQPPPPPKGPPPVSRGRSERHHGGAEAASLGPA